MNDKFEIHKEFYGRPILLSKEQMKKPKEVIGYFFSAIPLHEVRELLTSLLECAMITDNDYVTPSDRARVMNFFQLLEELIEAAYILIYGRQLVGGSVD